MEEALVWLSNPNRKITRSLVSDKNKSNKKDGNERQCISILEVKNNGIVRVILQIKNELFFLGLNPKNLSDFIYKTEKGIMNLSTFSY